MQFFKIWFKKTQEYLFKQFKSFVKRLRLELTPAEIKKTLKSPSKLGKAFVMFVFLVMFLIQFSLSFVDFIRKDRRGEVQGESTDVPQVKE